MTLDPSKAENQVKNIKNTYFERFHRTIFFRQNYDFSSVCTLFNEFFIVLFQDGILIGNDRSASEAAPLY